ncbi:MAG: hypothetical protein R3F56_04255 [Planctomycetota bacterium]
MSPPADVVPPPADSDILARARRWLCDPPGWLATVLLTTLGAALAIWTWGKTFHLFVDYGRELYVPWRITQGDVLYRDIAWFNGPLSAYLNAAVFWVFGPAIRTQALANLALVGAVTALVWQIGRALGGRGAALAAGLAWLLGSAFQGIDASGNFNWVSPYSHEMTHGVALALLALWLLRRAMRTDRRRAFAWCGVALGACLETKAEVGAAAFLAVVAGCLLHERGRGRALFATLAGAVVPLAGAFALLSTAMPAADALRATLGSFAHLGNAALRNLPYYEWCSGLDAPWVRLQSTGVWTVVLAGTLAPGLLLARAWTGSRFAAGALAGLLGLFAVTRVGALPIAIPLTLLDTWAAVAVFGAALLLRGRVPPWVAPAGASLVMLSVPWSTLVYEQVFLPLGLATLVVALVVAARVHAQRAGSDPDERADARWRIAFAVLALALLAKICLHVRIAHYGFGLAMPALVLVTVALWRVPDAIAARGGQASIARATVLGLATVLALGLLGRARLQMQTKRATFGARDDAFYVQEEAIAALWGRVATWIVTHTDPNATVAIMPEGVMVDYLTRRRNPTRHVNFMPPEILMFGEADILADFERHPPDYVALVHRPSVEYGLPLFGKDFAVELLAWIRAHYTVVERFGDEPLQQVERYGADMLKRK